MSTTVSLLEMPDGLVYLAVVERTDRGPKAGALRCTYLVLLNTPDGFNPVARLVEVAYLLNQRVPIHKDDRDIIATPIVYWTLQMEGNTIASYHCETKEIIIYTDALGVTGRRMFGIGI